MAPLPVSESLDLNAAQQLALSVVRKLRERGHQALWAGGCVRDQLRGEKPKDYDVATDARPEQIQQIFGRRRTRSIGAAFGVVSVVGPRRAGPIEVATFRRDEGYSDGRHPDRVTFTTAEEDARRRDFTVNGLFYDPIRLELIDYVDGQADVRDGIIRCIGNPLDRFHEDRLRMLRAVRFATTLGYEIETNTLAAIQQTADQIADVSAERIAGEMRRILVHEQRSTGLGLLRQTGLCRVVLPEYAVLEEPTRDDRWEEMEAVLDALQTDQFPTALAAALWPLCQTSDSVAASIVAKLGRRWKLTNHERSRTTWLLRNLTTARYARQVPWPQLQRVLVEKGTPELLAFSRAVNLGIDGSEEDYQFCCEQRKRPPEQLNPSPLVDGHDLQELGIPIGRHYSSLLDEIRDAQLDGQLQDRQEALTWAQSRWRQMCPHE